MYCLQDSWIFNTEFAVNFIGSMLNQILDTVKTKTVFLPYCLGLGSFKANSHITCRAHAVPLPCLAAKGLECVFPI